MPSVALGAGDPLHGEDDLQHKMPLYCNSPAERRGSPPALVASISLLWSVRTVLSAV